MKSIRFGIIGGGLMGKEFAAATARWPIFIDPVAKCEVVALASGRSSSFNWFTSNFASIKQKTTNWRELLKNDEIDALYIAVPHQLHEEMYVAAIEAGKHLFGEKPFGIDRAANDAIVAAAKRRPEVFVRCSSEFPFYPGAQKICDLIESGAFGKIIDVQSGFLHSSDLDPNKAINWKRQVSTNGEYGCMGDLGMHVCHIPFRAGWQPRDVRAVLAKIFARRPDGKGGTAPCDTWDNATLLCDTIDSIGNRFPWTLKTFRIAPGERNTWYIEIYGTSASVRWSTREPKFLELLEYQGKAQNWQRIQVGYEPPFKTITGPNFEFGFPDCFLQMVAAFTFELAGAPLKTFAALASPRMKRPSVIGFSPQRSLRNTKMPSSESDSRYPKHVIKLTGMRTILCALLVIGCSAVASPAAETPATTQSAHKLKVIFVTGGEAHDYAKLAPIVTAGIARYADVDITTRFGRDAQKDKRLADGFDAIVYDICYNGQDPVEYENLLAITRAGMPTVVIHATMHTFKPLPAWSEMLGMTSDRHDPYHPFTTIKLDPASPITRDWPENWKTAGDELYNTNKLWPTAHALLKVKSPVDGREHIVAWTNTYGAAKVFGTTLGHDQKTATDPDYQRLLARGLQWTCGQLEDAPTEK